MLETSLRGRPPLFSLVCSANERLFVSHMRAAISVFCSSLLISCRGCWELVLCHCCAVRQILVQYVVRQPSLILCSCHTATESAIYINMCTGIRFLRGRGWEAVPGRYFFPQAEGRKIYYICTHHFIRITCSAQR